MSFTWKKIEPKGKGPCPRRRQCCCIVGDKIVLFGGTRLGGKWGGLGEGPRSVTAREALEQEGPRASLSSFLHLFFDLYSPSPEEGLGDDFDLIDHSDLHILDFSKYTYSYSAVATESLTLDGDIEDWTLPLALIFPLSLTSPLKALV